MSTEAQKEASRRYYQKHKEYYKKKAIDNIKKTRKERNELIRELEELKAKLKGA